MVISTTTTIQNPTSIHKSNSYPKPTTLQNQRQSKTNLYPNTNDQSTTPIQRSLDCHLIKAFVAIQSMIHLSSITCCKDRENRHANIIGRVLDFILGAQVWVFSPECKKGKIVPKLELCFMPP